MMSKYTEQREAAWRLSEFVMSYPSTGDRGRMRGSSFHAPGTLHRSSCRYLYKARRDEAQTPSDVYPSTLEMFTKTANDSGVGNQYKVCKACCPEITVKGRNMLPEKPKKLKNRDEIKAEIEKKIVKYTAERDKTNEVAASSMALGAVYALEELLAKLA